MDASANRFLEGFTPAGRDFLMSCLIYQEYPNGAYLFHEGDSADGIYLVLEGEVESVKAAGNHEQILGLFKPGDFFGEVAVLDGYGRSTDARTRGAVSIAKIPRVPLMEALAKEPVSLTLGLFRHVLNHLRKTNDLFLHEVVNKEKLSLVGEMASSLMHDLRNPVSGIRLAADLINMTHADDETVHCCDGIRLQCDRLMGMAGELLEFSKGEVKLDLARTETTAFLQQFKILNEEHFRRTGIKFDLEAPPAPIVIDAMRLLRLLQNLITNAIEAIGSKPDGHIELRIWVEGATLYITVSDNGPGIPDEVKERLFEPFVTYGKKHGTGLGMAIAQNVVVAHGGAISFETAAGQGTRFLVQIPQNVPS
jgi:signal transduction histidine kinase